MFTKYYGSYAQDDFRVNPKLTLNYGLRLEHQDGLREKNNGITVAFDRTLTPPGPLGNVIVNGNPVRGGLVYAGVNGGTPIRAIRRGQGFASCGRRLFLQPQDGHPGRVWHLLGAENAPAPNTTNYGQVGFNQESLIQQGSSAPRSR